ncbi:site-specific DNA-methyltransferase [Pseudochelatococcus sp. B33]
MTMDAERLLNKGIRNLTPYPRNARTHSKKQIRQIADSIKKFGFTNPVLIDEHDHILAGHGRVEAAKLLGMDQVPCRLIASLSEAEKRAYIMADNKLALNAGWDEEILAIELQFLIEQAPEIDIGLTGFSVAEIDDLIDIGGTRDDTDPRDDRVPVVDSSAAATTETGDVWLLGDHRLVCGDAREADGYRLLMTAGSRIEQAQMVFTDPPYNVPIDGHVSGSGKIRHREFAMASGEMSREAFTAFLSTIIGHLVSFSADGSIHFLCIDWRHLTEMQQAGEAHYSDLKNLIVWVKDNGGMGSFYRSRHELIFAWKAGTAPHINSFELGQKGRYRTNVWNYRGVNSGGRTAREELALHPTVKPVAMVADAMKDCSSRGGIVLDPFCGSGTILIAAQKVGRRARAMEIDPHYCDTAILRWQRFAKDDAVLAATGETFAAARARRAAERLQHQIPDELPDTAAPTPGSNGERLISHE